MVAHCVDSVQFGHHHTRQECRQCCMHHHHCCAPCACPPKLPLLGMPPISSSTLVPTCSLSLIRARWMGKRSCSTGSTCRSSSRRTTQQHSHVGNASPTCWPLRTHTLCICVWMRVCVITYLQCLLLGALLGVGVEVDVLQGTLQHGQGIGPTGVRVYLGRTDNTQTYAHIDGRTQMWLLHVTTGGSHKQGYVNQHSH